MQTTYRSTSPKAAATFRRGQIGRLLAEIKEQADALTTGEHPDWTRVGDLYRIASDLEEIARTLRGEGES